ncbi:MAG: sodium:solute symporter family protein [Syntrophales bacterium]|nr:sodium:solute symporter family protein [Syntrophales bacterium]
MVWFIILYLLITIGVGLFAVRWVRSTEDYLIAGRRLPLYMVSCTLFATWFGSETVLGASAEFARGGLIAIIRDPFGAALCLFLVGLFFARPLYRLNLLTLGDFYRLKYGQVTEALASFCLVLTYLSWAAAQMVALGIVTNALMGLDVNISILVGCILVTLYTFFGGMWSVSVTDFMQMIFIVIGLIVATLEIFSIVSLKEVFAATPIGFFRFYPEPGLVNGLNYLAAWITVGLGSIAGQELFQRIMTSRSEKVAVRGALLAGVMYLVVATLPLLLTLAARLMIPDFLTSEQDTQLIIPHLVGKYASPLVQVLLFGALLSAILSTASATLLAPAAIISENVLRPRLKNVTDQKLLWISRMAVLFIALISLYLALMRGNIYALVGEAASLGLVSLFVPLAFGLFWKKATARGALLAIIFGLLAWLIARLVETSIEPIIFGLTASLLFMLLGSGIYNFKLLPFKKPS